MNRVQPENVHSTIFTPREYQVELVDASLRGNTLSVLAASRSTRTFLITMVTREKAHQTRDAENGGKGMRTLITGWSGSSLVQAGEAIQQNTNLAVSTFTDLAQVQQFPDRQQRWKNVFLDCQVVILTVDVLGAALEEKVIPLENLNLLVITDAHRINSSEILTKVVSGLNDQCAVMGLTCPVLNHNASPPQLDSFFSHMQDATRCRVDTASEILTVLRYVNKPMEKIIMCSEPDELSRTEVEEEVRKLIEDSINFLEEHRYDLCEVYGPEYLEFCQDIPDPKKEPIQILKDFLDILNELGLWSADRAALYALVEIEKLKKKTAYDRHYLLLCMIFSTMAKIRAIVETTFDKFSELDQILKFSSPKVLRLIEILRQIRPLNFVDPRKRREKLELLENGRTETVSNKGTGKENMEEDEDMDILGVINEKDVLLDGASCSDSDIEEPPKVTEYIPSAKITDYVSSEDDDEDEDEMNMIVEPKITDYVSSEEDDTLNIMVDTNEKDMLLDGASCTDSETEEPKITNNKTKVKHKVKSKKKKKEKSLANNLISDAKTEGKSVLEDSLCRLSISNDTKISNDTNKGCDKTRNGIDCDDNLVVENKVSDTNIVCNGFPSTHDKGLLDDDDFVMNEPIEVKNDTNVAASENNKSSTSVPEVTSSKENSTTSTNNVPSGLSAEAVALADTLAQLLPGGGLSAQRTRKHRGRDEVKEKVKVHNPDDPDSVCGLVFVGHRNVAKIIYRLLKELSDIGGDFAWIFPQYTVESKETIKDDQRAAEAEHKKQEEVLRRFRHHECNLLVSTRILEEGIDVPQCNLVLRFDPSIDYRSYVNSLGRARGLQDTFYLHLVTHKQEAFFLRDMATYHAFHQVLMSRSPATLEEPTDKEVTSEEANAVEEPFITPADVKVTMTTAIGLLNKYCAKLPSDTFTRLTAMWEMEEKVNPDKDQASIDGCIKSLRSSNRVVTRPGMLYRCSIMLPINSPLKTTIKGLWLPKVSLSKMNAALETCRTLHRCGELDDQLLPVGKESMRLDDHLAPPPPDDNVPQGMPRPGTTKRRQYYYKKVAQCLTGTQPKEAIELYVYKLNMVLTCPIPDEQNTRGRKIYRPEHSSRSFGLVTTKAISQLSSFPVFTRSGEVVVSLKELQRGLRVTEKQLGALQCFHKFTFTHVLRLEKYPIKFDPTNACTAFYIVPLNKGVRGENIDWSFVEMIQAECDPRPVAPSEDSRKNLKFDHTLYEDAVVMPWYRNQDQPQYFYVAEICGHLNPQSDFPDAGFETFEKYYLTKYGLQICNISQPLLDVDHTSGRLNLLTPRHVNRKGVALPTTSEETKRAKRENLQQKQILVPELCTIHPFPASLWRKAVCLPTILYRINALLIADQLRLQVATQVGLGLATLPKAFSWPQLDFGWCLADVLKKNGDNSEESNKDGTEKSNEEDKDKKSGESSESSETGKKEDGSLEIGTWSNDMAINPPTPPPVENEELEFEIDTFDPNVALPDNLMLIEQHSDDDMDGELGADWGTGLKARKSKKKDGIPPSDGQFRVGSPSNFEGEVPVSKVSGGVSGQKWQHGNSYGSDGYGGYGDFQGLANDLEGCESDLSSDMDDDDEDDDKEEDSSWEEETNKHHGGVGSLGVDEDRTEDDEDMDLLWPGEDQDHMQTAEGDFHKFLTDKQEEIKCGPMYLAQDEPLVIEKSHRKEGYVPRVVAVKQNRNHGMHLSQGPIDNNSGENKQGCDNTIATQIAATIPTSSPVKLVNREATLTMSEDFGNGVTINSSTSGVMPLCRNDKLFSFDYQPNLLNHPGPSPSVILQALTMSNANDGVNLERLETIGDSFLKYAITTFLYCTYPQRHEGKLSYLRSKQVSNLNLYRLGKRKGMGECMVATKFEPHDNWLPPGYFVPRELEEALIDSGVPAGHWNMADLPGLHDLPTDQIRRLVQERSEQIKRSKAEALNNDNIVTSKNPAELPIFIPYNLLTQHSIPDKSIADCVEALIGAYLTTCGPRGALLFMTWLGIRVLPCEEDKVLEESSNLSEPIVRCTYGHLNPPQSPLNNCPDENPQDHLTLLLSGYNVFEEKIGYRFRDRSYLLQAFTHASYYKNRLTDCYQRLEFLGDAVLDYLITRHLYEDRRQHSPGALTDLRSALVNNTIFASLAVKYDFHKYFRHFSPGLDRVVRDFVKMQEENGHKINEEYYFMEEDECEAAEDIEVPKALGDVFESVAGAVFLDSGASLDAVWAVYHNMMSAEIEQFSGVVPKSPIRELLEMEPETAKFGKPERLVDGKVRVSVEIFGKGSFSGVGRNYRIAKSTAAKRALRHLKKMQMMANQSNL